MDDEAPTLAPDVWLDIVRSEYLQSYVNEGGAAVKVPVTDDPAVWTKTWNDLTKMAKAAGFTVAEIDSAQTRIHMAEQVFHQIAGQMPWHDLVERVAIDSIAGQTGYEVQPGDGTPAERMASQYGWSTDQVKQALTDGLAENVWGDPSMAREFRHAMVRLVRDASGIWTSDRTDSEAIVAWLTGQKMNRSLLKPYGIHSPINRANAALMLESLAHWVRKAGRPGIVLLIDVRRLVEPPPRPRTEGQWYTRPMLLDAYEVLRQLVDATDRLEGVLVVVFAATPFLDTDDRGRGMAAYQALYYRLSDVGISASVANPMASLVRLDE